MTVFTGATVDEAITRGLKSLRAKRENVHIEIEQHETNGFLGFGKKRARVNIEPIEDDTVRRADRQATRGVDQSDMEIPEAKSAMEATLELRQVAKQVREKTAQIKEATEPDDQEIVDKVKANVKNNSSRPEGRLSRTEKKNTTESNEARSNQMTEEEERVAVAISKYLSAITVGIEVPAVITAKKEGSLLIFELKSKQDALLIGKHGKVLQSLQMLAKAYSGMLTDERIHIAVNVGDYHEKRKAYISSLAHRAASRAREGETVYINDLQASERKIVHNIISQESGINSHSEGNDNKRYIVVSRNI